MSNLEEELDRLSEPEKKDTKTYITKLEQFVFNSCYQLGMPLLDYSLNSEDIPLDTKILLLDFALDELSKQYIESLKK